MTRCSATRADGNPCRAPAVGGGAVCFFHSECRDEFLRAASSGGSRRSIQLPEREPLTPERTRAILAGLMEAVLCGAVEPGAARAAGYLVQIDLQVQSALELGKRVEAIEQALDELHKEGDAK